MLLHFVVCVEARHDLLTDVASLVEADVVFKAGFKWIEIFMQFAAVFSGTMSDTHEFSGVRPNRHCACIYKRFTEYSAPPLSAL